MNITLLLPQKRVGTVPYLLLLLYVLLLFKIKVIADIYHCFTILNNVQHSVGNVIVKVGIAILD